MFVLEVEYFFDLLNCLVFLLMVLKFGEMLYEVMVWWVGVW